MFIKATVLSPPIAIASHGGALLCNLRVIEVTLVTSPTDAVSPSSALDLLELHVSTRSAPAAHSIAGTAALSRYEIPVVTGAAKLALDIDIPPTLCHCEFS
jgi:hypothetical protein